MIYLLSMLLALSAVLNVIVWYAWRCQDDELTLAYESRMAALREVEELSASYELARRTVRRGRREKALGLIEAART